MADKLKNRFDETLAQLKVFEESLARLSQDPNNAQLPHEIGNSWALAKAGFDLTNCATLARCSDDIERILDELFDGVPATEEIVARLVSSADEMRDFLISDEGQVKGHADANDVDSIILKLQAALDILAGRRRSLSEVEEKLSPTAPTRELHILEISADDLERALSRSDIEIVCSSNTPIADPTESDSPPILQTLERPLPRGEVSSG